MLTPQEVQEKKFKQSFIGGYEMAGVDDFLETLTTDYSALFKENALLKNKIRVLVDKLEEYRKVDDSMRQALLGAQKMAEKIKNEAAEKSQKTLGDMQKEFETRRKQLQTELIIEESRLEKARKQTVTFVNSLREIYARQSEQLAAIPDMMPPPPSPRKKREDETARAAKEIADSVNAKIQEDMVSEPPAESAPEPSSPKQEPSARAAEPAGPPLQKASAPAMDDTRPASSWAVSEATPQSDADSAGVQTFEVIFGDKESMTEDDVKLLWEPEHDTEVPRPKFDFADLENQFGTDKTIVIDRKRR